MIEKEIQEIHFLFDDAALINWNTPNGLLNIDYGMKNIVDVNEALQEEVSSNFHEFSNQFLLANFSKTYASLQNCLNFFPRIKERIDQIEEFIQLHQNEMNQVQKNQILEEITELDNVQKRCASNFVASVKACRIWLPHFIMKLDNEGLNNEKEEMKNKLTEINEFIDE